MRSAVKIAVVAAVAAAAIAAVALRPVGQPASPKPDAAPPPQAVFPLPAGAAPIPPAPSPAGLPRLLELGSDRCQACKAMAPVLEELRAGYAGRLRVDFIDVWVDKTAVATYRVDLIPTQVYFDGAGRELGRRQGFHSAREIAETFRSFGVSL